MTPDTDASAALLNDFTDETITHIRLKLLDGATFAIVVELFFDWLVTYCGFACYEISVSPDGDFGDGKPGTVEMEMEEAEEFTQG